MKEKSFFSQDNIDKDELFREMISYFSRPLVPFDYDTEEEFWQIVDSDRKLMEQWASSVDYKKAFKKIKEIERLLPEKTGNFLDRKLIDTLDDLKDCLIEKHNIEFDELYAMGERNFRYVDFELKDFSNRDIEGCFFEECIISSDFSHSNLKSSRFLNCNLNTSIFLNSNLTDVTIENCSVEGTVFKGAITENCQLLTAKGYRL